MQTNLSVFQVCRVNWRVGFEAGSIYTASGGRGKWICFQAQPFAHYVSPLLRNMLERGSKTAENLAPVVVGVTGQWAAILFILPLWVSSQWCTLWYGCKGDALWQLCWYMQWHKHLPPWKLDYEATFSPKALSSLQSIWCGDEQRKDQKQMEIMIGKGMGEKELKSRGNWSGYLSILYSRSPPSSIPAPRCGSRFT